jgi:hypothetical protein
MDMTKAVLANSDRLNAVDLTGPVVVTVTDVREGSGDKPVLIITDRYGPDRPFMPAKTVLRDVVNAWSPGEDLKAINVRAWIGRRMGLYVEPDVKWAGKPDPGIRINALSHIAGPMDILIYLGGKGKKPGVIQPLPDAPTVDPAKIEAAHKAITNATDHAALDAIEHHATSIGIQAHITDALRQRREELG